MSIPTSKPINYVNNRDILKEIHISKTSYCSFVNPTEDHKYDFIVEVTDGTMEDLFEYMCRPETIQKAKEVHAARKSVELGEKQLPESIEKTDLVFRLMTWDHIPMAAKQPRKVVKKKTAKDVFDFEESDDLFGDLEDPTLEINDLVHVRVNFPPFQHYKFDVSGAPRCVGKSHWKGDLVTGEFSKDHGQTTNKLAKMYIMLCEKYAMKYNWRGYSYVDEFINTAILQLTYVGLRFNEARSSNGFAYFTQIVNNAFLRVLNSEKKTQHLRDDLLQANNLNPSYTRQGSSAGQYEE